LPTHGSLSKAGKVRSQNPRSNLKPKKKSSPKIHKKKAYLKQIILGRNIGQYRPGRRRRR
jgi:small subunit ribosomal protein S30e